MKENNDINNNDPIKNYDSIEPMSKGLKRIVKVTRIPYIFFAFTLISLIIMAVVYSISNSNKINAIFAIPLLCLFLDQLITIPISIVGLILCIIESIKNKTDVKKYILLNIASLVYGIIKCNISFYVAQNF